MYCKPFSFFAVLSLLLVAATAQSPSPPQNTRHVRHHGHGSHHHHGHRQAPPVTPPPPPPPPPTPVPAHHHRHHGHRHASPPPPVPVSANRHRHHGSPQAPPHVTQAPSKDAKANGVFVKGSSVVDKNGSGNFTTIGQAVAAAPVNLKANDGYFVIYIKGGVYEEYITIPSDLMYVMFVGDGMNSTVITGDRNAAQGLSGYNSATVAVEGDGFVATDVTFRNTAGPTNGQAVALRNNANRSAFFRCSIEGYQDTLYAHSSQQFYRECNIYGTVDFIYGEASAVFQKCNILARRPLHGHHTTVVTAQGREDAAHFSATAIQNCKIDAAPDLLADGASAHVYLGRPWKPFATVAVMQSYMGAVVAPAGWEGSHGTEDSGTLFYGEYENYGPGADTRRRVRWPGVSGMNATRAADFTVANLLQGDTWLPQTKVPFYAGLIESS